MKNDKLDSIQKQQHRVSCTRDCRIIIYQLGLNIGMHKHSCASGI